MKKHTYRSLIIAATLFIAGIYIYPTVGWIALSEDERVRRLEIWRNEDSAFSESSLFGDMTKGVKRWAQFNRDWVINLGLDLPGNAIAQFLFEHEQINLRPLSGLGKNTKTCDHAHDRKYFQH